MLRVACCMLRVAYPFVHVPLQERLAQLPGGLRHPELLSVWDQWSYFQHEDKIIFVDDAERFVRLRLRLRSLPACLRAFPCSEALTRVSASNPVLSER